MKRAIEVLMVITLLFVCYVVCLEIRKIISSPNNTSGANAEEVISEIEAGAPGTLVYDGANRQKIRMWEQIHRMEWWLMHQNKITVQRVYYIPLSPNYVICRYYVQYVED